MSIGPNPQDPLSPLYTFVDTQPLSVFPNNPDSSPSHFTELQRTPTAITATLPVVVTCAAHGFVDGNVIRSTKFITATGMGQLNNRQFCVQNATTDTFELWDVSGYAIDGITYTPYVSGGQFTLSSNTPLVVNPSVFPV